MKNVLILGANSYIGTSFQKYIKENYPHEFQVECISLRGDGWQRTDWSKYDSVVNVTGKAHADIGNMTEEQKREYYTVNCHLACRAAKKAIADGVGQYIYFSSIIVYGDSSAGRPMHIDKDTAPEPSNFYGDSKWQAEQELTQLFADCGTALALLRPPMIYGKGSKGNFQMLSKLAGKLPFFPKMPNERSVLYIENLAEFLRILVEKRAAGEFFPQDADYVTTAELVRQIGLAKGKKIRLVSWLNPFVLLAQRMPGKAGGMARKAFGSLTVDMELSRRGIDGYRRFELEESVRRSVGGDLI